MASRTDEAVRGRGGWGAVSASTPARYALALAVVGLAFGSKMALGQFLGPTTYLLFYPAVMLAAVLAGLGPGLLATAAATALSLSWVLPAELQDRPMGRRDLASLATFATMSVLMSVVAELYRQARAQVTRQERSRAIRESEARSRMAEEEALHRYELLAAHSRDILLFMRRDDGRLLEANAAAVQAYGYPRQELLTLTIHELRAAGTRPAAADQMTAADDRGLLFETVHRRRDGSTFPVEVSSQGSTIDGTRTLISVVRDITERRRAEEALQTALQRFYLVLSSMYSAVLLVTDEGRIEFVNPSFCRRFALKESPSELAGLSAADLDERIKGAYQDPQAAVARIREILEQGQPVLGEELLMRDGGTCLRDFVPLSVEGRPCGRLWIHVDITERKRAEEALRDNEARYRAFFDNLSEAVVVLDAVRDQRGQVVDWRCVASNQAHSSLFGLERQQIVGLLVSQAMSPAGFARVAARNLRVLASGQRETEALEVRGRHVLSTAFRIGPGTLAVTGLDVTERRQAEDALREADRRKTEFLAVLSHELRNPLGPIRNSVHLLDRAAPGGDTARRAREVLQRQTAHLSRLVDDLLDVTRITHGKIELQTARLDACEVVRRACDDARDAYQQRGVELRGPGGAGPIWIDGDAARLTQMVDNLLTNALKFTPPRGQVEVQARAGDGACRIAVRDSGVGIEPADLERIFDPFVQPERTRPHAGAGLGLGLALVRELARLHGGTVRAVSDGPGRGAEFLLVVPLAPAAPAAEPTTRAPTGPGGLSVLIVEDNEDAGATLADLLTLLGHRAEVTSSGRAGLEAAAARPPDVVICDIGLPDTSGYEVMRAIRAGPSTAAAFAIALTGYAQAEDRRLALEAGFDAHLAKPMSIDRLHQLLAEAGARRRRVRA